MAEASRPRHLALGRPGLILIALLCAQAASAQTALTSRVNLLERRLNALLTSATTTVPPADLKTGTTIGGAAIGSGGAPTNATYLVQDLNGSLSAEIAFGAAVANQCVTGVSGGAVTRAQPAFSWLTGVASDAQVAGSGEEDEIDLLDLRDGAADDCIGLDLVRRNAGDSAFECAPAAADDDVPEAADFGNLSTVSPLTQSPAGTLTTAMNTARLIGRGTAGVGVMEELTLGASLELSGTQLRRAALTGDVSALVNNNTTSVDNVSAGATVSIDETEVQLGATDRLVGRDAAGAGGAEELTVGGGLEFTGAGGVQRSALTGDVTASAGSGATTVANVPASATVAIDAGEVASGILGAARGGTGVVLPTCVGTDKLTANGTAVSCATDQTSGGGGAGYAEIAAAALAGF